MHESLKLTIPHEGITFLKLSLAIGDVLQNEYLSILKLKKYNELKKKRFKLNTENKNSPENNKSISPFDSFNNLSFTESDVTPLLYLQVHWSKDELIKAGSILLNILISNCTFEKNNLITPAFLHELINTKNSKKVGVIKCHPSILKEIESNHFLQQSYHTRFMPMIVPPKPWSSLFQGKARNNTKVVLFPRIYL